MCDGGENNMGSTCVYSLYFFDVRQECLFIKLLTQIQSGSGPQPKEKKFMPRLTHTLTHFLVFTD